MLDRDSILRLPKVELHVHLEGSIQPATLLQLAKKNNVPLPADDLDGLEKWFNFRDFDHFVEIYTTSCNAIRSAEDLEYIAEEFARNQKSQNVLYTEVTYTADTIFEKTGIPFSEQIQALRSGFDRVEGTEVNLILDIVREVSVERGLRTCEWCVDGMRYGVVAIGLSGFEGRTPVKNHQTSFELAKKAGLGVSAHAGETAGPESIREVLEFAKADRIGHGIRCLEDGNLTAELRDQMIHVEVNPTSNVRLKVVDSIESHPIGKMIDEGLSVSINSDDPPMFGTTITDELFKVGNAFELNEDILYTLTLNAARNSFLEDEERKNLVKLITEGYQACNPQS